MSDAPKRKVKQKWAIEKPKLDNARMKNARRELEIPMPAAMLCKLQHCPYTETCCAVGEHMTNMLVLLKPTNP